MTIAEKIEYATDKKIVTFFKEGLFYKCYNEKLSYQLFDMQGKQLSNGQIVAQQTQINMNNLPTATYFINVVNQENRKVQSFKIIKN